MQGTKRHWHKPAAGAQFEAQAAVARCLQCRALQIIRAPARLLLQVRLRVATSLCVGRRFDPAKWRTLK